MISIIIPSHNSEKTIKQALEGCFMQRYPAGKFEVIVVDDGSSDATREIVSSYLVKYLFQEHGGPAKARNTGCKNSKGEFLCFLDADCVPQENWLAETLQYFAKKDVACVGTKYTIANRQNLLARCIYAEFLARYSRMPREVKFTGSGVCSFRREPFEEAGGYDESYTTSSGEDNNLCYRLVNRGYKVVLAEETSVAHFFPTNTCFYLRTQFKHGYWRMKMYRDHPKMMKGENYATPLDFIQPPLMLIATILSILSLLLPGLGSGVLLAVCACLLLQLPFSILILTLGKPVEALVYIPLGFVRALVRSWGMFFGILRFWFRK